MTDPLILCRQQAFRASGFSIEQRSGSDVICFSDLNPVKFFDVVLSRGDRLKLAWWFLLAAVWKWR